MSTLKTDAIEAATGTNTDLSLDGKGSGVPDLGAGFKVGGSAGVPTASIQDDAVTLAKMASGTDGVIITYDASGNPVHVGPGTDGQVLTSTGAGSPPAFENAAGGGAWTTITTTDVSAVSEIVFTGFAAGTYSHYQFWIQDIAIDATTNLRMRTSSDGGSSYDTGASDYQWVHGRVRGGSTDQGWDETDENIEVAGDGNVYDWDTDNNSFFSAVMNVFSPEDTRETSFTWVAGWIGGGGDLNCGYYSATRKSTADVDAIKFYPASGAFKALGTIKMLGLENQEDIIMFAVVADWDINGRVTRSNLVETEEEAKRLVDRLRGLPPSDARRKEMEEMASDKTISKGMRHWASKESVALPADKVAPKTYYAVITSPDPRCDDCLHLAGMWDAD